MSIVLTLPVSFHWTSPSALRTHRFSKNPVWRLSEILGIKKLKRCYSITKYKGRDPGRKVTKKFSFSYTDYIFRSWLKRIQDQVPDFLLLPNLKKISWIGNTLYELVYVWRH